MTGVRVSVGAAKARPGRLRRFASAVGALRRLPCDARSHGPVAELTTLPAVAAFGQRRRVRPRCALRARPRALRFSAPQRRAFACPGVPLLNQRWPARQDEPAMHEPGMNAGTSECRQRAASGFAPSKARRRALHFKPCSAAGSPAAGGTSTCSPARPSAWPRPWSAGRAARAAPRRRRSAPCPSRTSRTASCSRRNARW